MHTALKYARGMEILNRIITPLIFPLVPHIPIGIGMGFIGKIRIKVKITPPDTIAFRDGDRMRIFEDFMN
jgi:hypothetical protein